MCVLFDTSGSIILTEVIKLVHHLHNLFTSFKMTSGLFEKTLDANCMIYVLVCLRFVTGIVSPGDSLFGHVG